MTEQKTKKIIAKACKFASTHTIDSSFSNEDKDDLTCIKERIFYDDGTEEDNLKLVENYQRPFWITKPAFRNHKSKKEWEDKDKLDTYMATQSTLNDRVQQVLGKQTFGGIRKTNRNPYVYGTDTSAATLIKMQYAKKWPDKHGFPMQACFYDVETDVLGDFKLSEENWEKYGDAIICATLAMADKAVTFALRKFAHKRNMNCEKQFFEVLDRDMPHIRKPAGELINHVKTLGLPVELKLYETEKEMLIDIFETLHQWKPDVVSSWNISFDVPRTEQRLLANGLMPKDYFSDPSIPEKYRHFEFIRDEGVQVSASGKKKTKLFYQCWHMVKAPASFRWVDACSVYWYVRKVHGNLKSAALDYVLSQEIGRGKYEVEEASKYKALDKHIFLQREYPVEYLVYNLFDCVGLVELENKNHDIGISLTGALGITEFENLHSNPKKLMNNLFEHLYYNRNKILGCTSDQMVDDLDKYIVPQKGWIVALPTNSIEYKGIKAVKELPDLHSKIYLHCADLDVKSSYPSTGIFANISRETTVLELSQIEGIIESDRYLLGLNIMGANVNAVSFCQMAYGMPSLDELDELYQESLYSTN